MVDILSLAHLVGVDEHVGHAGDVYDDVKLVTRFLPEISYLEKMV